MCAPTATYTNDAGWACILIGVWVLSVSGVFRGLGVGFRVEGFGVRVWGLSRCRCILSI